MTVYFELLENTEVAVEKKKWMISPCVPSSINIEGVEQNVSKGKRYIIVYAGSEKGFVPNCLLIFSGKNKMEYYHSEMNAHNFTKWITEKLIPNLHEPSIIVFDNDSYHSVITNKAPTSSSRV
ncbi:unnamed protein product [Euphydryas editha]|uniref:DDE-1 domain-containing protein n=1 Tax=Euphydryas editha TaxID=104508 RepID=A0AAU9U158_EUPED|nr:unnamed protein product [Euphydryas editha]